MWWRPSITCRWWAHWPSAIGCSATFQPDHADRCRAGDPAGIMIIWRERQLGLERARRRKAMTPQGQGGIPYSPGCRNGPRARPRTQRQENAMTAPAAPDRQSGWSSQLARSGPNIGYDPLDGTHKALFVCGDDTLVVTFQPPGRRPAGRRRTPALGGQVHQQPVGMAGHTDRPPFTTFDRLLLQPIPPRGSRRGYAPAAQT